MNNQSNQSQEKKFVCKSCGSQSQRVPGTCCGAEREEKKENMAHNAGGHERKADDTRACGRN